MTGGLAASTSIVGAMLPAGYAAAGALVVAAVAMLTGAAVMLLLIAKPSLPPGLRPLLLLAATPSNASQLGPAASPTKRGGGSRTSERRLGSRSAPAGLPCFSAEAPCAAAPQAQAVPEPLARTALDVEALPLSVAELRAALFQAESPFFAAWFRHMGGVRMTCGSWARPKAQALEAQTDAAGSPTSGSKPPPSAEAPACAVVPLLSSLSQQFFGWQRRPAQQKQHHRLGGCGGTAQKDAATDLEGLGLRRELHFVTTTSRTRQGTMESSEVQTVLCNRPQDGVVVVESLIDPGRQVPFGSCFRIREQWALLAHGDAATSRMRVSVQVVWLKPCPLKPIINRAVHAQVAGTLSKFEDFVHQKGWKAPSASSVAPA